MVTILTTNWKKKYFADFPYMIWLIIIIYGIVYTHINIFALRSCFHILPLVMLTMFTKLFKHGYFADFLFIIRLIFLMTLWTYECALGTPTFIFPNGELFLCLTCGHSDNVENAIGALPALAAKVPWMSWSSQNKTIKIFVVVNFNGFRR